MTAQTCPLPLVAETEKAEVLGPRSRELVVLKAFGAPVGETLPLMAALVRGFITVPGPKLDPIDPVEIVCSIFPAAS